MFPAPSEVDVCVSLGHVAGNARGTGQVPAGASAVLSCRGAASLPARGDARLRRGRPDPKGAVGTWAGLGQIPGSKHDSSLVTRNVRAKGKKPGAGVLPQFPVDPGTGASRMAVCAGFVTRWAS